ncbi:MAG: hypothetical protein COB73_06960 [Flavobacteriaceae bacterium]|nr:MAG: hypothetical protein COB73_06960 [Flavobacteriaceae bacterium]
MKKLIILICLILSITLSAQITETDKTMLWTTISVSKKINDKFSISYNQLNSVDLASPRFNFIQPDIRINYKITKKVIATVGYAPTFSLDQISGNQLVYHRVAGRIRLRTKLGKRIRMSNSITAEHHLTQRSKFQQRYYYKLDLYYRNTSLPWRLRPYLTQKLYYYANGRDLQYYDDSGNMTDLKSPNGLHAYRIEPGIKFYPTKKFYFSVYYLRQIEFNAGGSEISNLNPNTGNIRRPFYNFNVIGLKCGLSL